MITICTAIAAFILSKAGIIWEGVVYAMLVTVIGDLMLFVLLIFQLTERKK